MHELRALLIDGRSRLGVDQIEFGKRVGVGQQAVSRWERGGSRPRRAMAAKVAQVLDIPVEEVLTAAGYIGAVADSPGEISPAVRPLSRTLPFHELSAERFEDACAEVLEHLHPGGHASRFGGPGETQHGIDLLLTLDGTVQATGQCKRHSAFGPQKVADAVSVVAEPAAVNYLFLSRQIATAAARTKMAQYAGWQLWDGEDLSRYIRNQMSKDEAVRFVDTYFPSHREPFLGVRQPGPWSTIAEFYATTRTQALFHHEWLLCGRADELAVLESGLRASDDAVAILFGRGGIGKTRLLRTIAETFENDGWQVRLLQSNAAPDPAAIEQLPIHSSALLIIDDAHVRSDMGQIISQVRAWNPNARLLITCRPYGKQRLEEELRRAGCDLWGCPTVELGDLTLDQSSALAKEALGTDNDMLAERLAMLTRDCPLATTIGGNLIRTGVLHPRELEQDERIRERILSGFRSVLVDSSGHGERETRSAVIDALSVLQPFRSGTQVFRDAIAELVGQRYSRISHHLQSLEDSGVLIRRNDSLRLVPDLLGDVVLSQACFDRRSGVDSGYLSEVLEAASGEALENAFVNVARVDWQVGHQLAGASAAFWSRIQARLEQRDLETHLKVLKLLGRVAVFQAEQSIRAVGWILDHPLVEQDISIDDASVLFRWTWRHVLDEISVVLRATSTNLDSVVGVGNRLWQLAQADRRAMHQYPNHPLRVLQEMAEYLPNKPITYNERMLELAESWITDDWPLSPLTAIESLVATEGHTTRYRDNTLTFYPFAVIPEGVSLVRWRAIELALDEIRSGDVGRGVAGAKYLQIALHYPSGAFGRTVNEAELRAWDGDFTQILDALVDILRTIDLDPTVAVAIFETVHWHACYGSGAPRDTANSVIAEMPDTIAFDIALLLHDGWGHLLRTDSMDVDEYLQATRERQDHTTTRALRELDDIALVQLVEDRLGRETTFEHGGNGAHPLLNGLIEKRASIAKAAVDRLFAAPESVLCSLIAVIVDAVGRQLPATQMSLVERLMSHPSSTVVSEAAYGLAVRDRSRCPLHAGELELLRGMAVSPDERTREAVVSAVCALGATDPGIAANLLAAVSFSDSMRVATRIFDSLTWEHSGIAWTDLDSHQQSSVLDQLADIVDVDAHSIMQFLRRYSAEAPARVIRLLRSRIEASEAGAHTSRFKPVPHSWPESLAIREHPDFLICLRELLAWIGDGSSWQRQRMGQSLFAAAVGSFDEPVLSLLLEILRTGSHPELEAVACVLGGAPNSLVFDQVEFVTDALVAAARLGPDALALIENGLWASSIRGVRMGTPGQPYSEDVRLRDQCAQIADALPPTSDTANFYRSLSESASRSIEHDTQPSPADGRDW